MTDLHVAEWGSGPRVVLVHGTILWGEPTWGTQRELAGRWNLVVPDRRGYGGSNGDAVSDFEQDGEDVAALLEDGAHLVGLSYGGIGSVIAAAARPEAVRSLTLIEPALLSLVLDNPEVAAWVAERGRILETYGDDPRGYLEVVLNAIGAAFPLPDPLPEIFEAGARASIKERFAGEAELPMDDVAAGAYPKLVISGGHLDAWEAICDRAASIIGADRAVLKGVGHFLPLHHDLNGRLESFWRSAEVAA